MSATLPIIKIGRTTCTIDGHDFAGRPVQIPAGSLLRILEVSHTDQAPDNMRYSAVLLNPSGEIYEPLVYCDAVWDGLLAPEPGILTWTPEDDAAARMQGWSLLIGEGEHFELTAEDPHDRFGNHTAAWLFVWQSALSGENPVASKALAFLYQREPLEYAEIKKFGSGRPQ